jgi:heme/copper-type cytochrome/quinol oxidase subunit 2
MIRGNLTKTLVVMSATIFLLSGFGLAAEPTTSEPRVIQVTADKDNVFKLPGQGKPVITMKPGEKATFRITSHFGGEKANDGTVHSFVVKALRDQGWDVRLKEGTEDVSLVAPQQAGEYKIECTVKCGRGHDDMNMKLVVRN